MARAKAKELDNRREGDRRRCVICSPKPGRIAASRLWEWALRNPGKRALR